MSMPDPGWYDDGRGALRWWDGAGWTDRVAEPQGSPARPEEEGAAGSRAIDDARGPAPESAGSPRRRRAGRWILFGALALAVIVAIVAGTFVIMTAQPVGPAPASASPSEEQRKAAQEIIEQYAAAWDDADCPLFLKVTTAEFRAPAGMDDCSVFETRAEEFAASAEDYDIEVTAVRGTDSGLSVATTETFSVLADDEGTAPASAMRDSIDYEYLLVPIGARWTIQQIDLPGPGGGASPGPSPSPSVRVIPDESVASIRAFDQALFSLDCDLFLRATTAHYRYLLGVDECSRFSAAAKGRAEVVLLSMTAPESVRAVGRGMIVVEAGVVQESLVDEYGLAVPEPVVLTRDHRFHLIRSAAEWKIDDVHDVTDGRGEGEVLRAERSAVEETMQQWRRVNAEADCDAAMASTTARFRESVGWTGCDAVQRSLEEYAGLCDLDTRVDEMRYATRVDSWRGVIFVDVIESCLQDSTDTGEPIDPPLEFGTPYRLHLIPADGTWKINDSSDGAAAEDEPANVNERAAVEAIRAYDAAWYSGDCAAYLRVTSAVLRSNLGLAACPDFEDASADQAESFLPGSITPIDIERLGSDEMQITTHERYQARYDIFDQPADPPIDVDEYYRYTVLIVDGAWVVDDVVMLQ